MLHKFQPHAELLRQIICLYQYTPNSPAREAVPETAPLFDTLLRKILNKSNYWICSPDELKYISRAVAWYVACYPDGAETVQPLQDTIVTY